MEKINIAALLQDCPAGMELDCMMYDDVYFDYVDELNIIHCYIKNEGFNTSITFNQHGTPHSDAKSKCVIFPKGKTTWKGFHRPFRDGDIIYAEDDYSDATFTYVAILKRIENESGYLEIYSHCFYNYEDDYFSTGDFPYDGFNIKFATEKEKADLFKAINDNGYHWDEETKTLEKLPRFKVGDRVRCINNIDNKFKITGIANNYYICENDFRIYFKFQENWELVKDTTPIFKIGDKIRHKDSGIHCTLGEYSEGISAYRTNIGLTITYKELEQWELAPNKFDIGTLKPFDKVLVRCSTFDKWCTQFFEKYNKAYKHPFICMGYNKYKQCIPYEGNEHLLDTKDECDNFFKVWEES